MPDSLQHHGLQSIRILCPWGFSRQEYWSGLPCLPPGDLPSPGIQTRSPALQADSLPTEPPVKPRVRLATLMYLVDGFILLPMSLTSKTQILSATEWLRSPTWAWYSACLIPAVTPTSTTLEPQATLGMLNGPTLLPGPPSSSGETLAPLENRIFALA